MTYTSGYSLPADILWDRARMQRLFERKWFFVGMRADVARPRDFLKFDLLGEEYFLIHGHDGVIRCFVNRCAHQSARLVFEPSGRSGPRIVCPNHQWAFDTASGKLAHAGHMPDGFLNECTARENALTEIPLRETGRMLFACLGDEAPDDDFAAMQELLAPYTRPFEMAGHGYKRAAHHRAEVSTNWLLAMINNRECCHCSQNHKRLLPVFDPSSFNGDFTPEYAERLKDAQARWEAKGLAWRERAFDPVDHVRVSRYPLGEGFKSISYDGELVCENLIGPFAGGKPDAGTLSFWLNPNSWVHFTTDHITANWILPLSEDRCVYYTSWIVHEGAEEGVDYSLERLMELWLQTNAEDTGLCHSMSDGTRSRYYKPGPFAPAEQFCTQFCDWYVKYSA